MIVQEYLKQHDVSCEVIDHRPTYAAQRMAQEVHAPGHEVAKTVLLRADGGYVYLVAVLPATHNVDLDRVGKALGGGRIELATEVEISQHCPDCEFGALPPFGSQYGMRTIVDETLIHDDEIVFEGNTHGQAIRMKYDDFRRLEEPLIAQFAHRK